MRYLKGQFKGENQKWFSAIDEGDIKTIKSWLEIETPDWSNCRASGENHLASALDQGQEDIALLFLEHGACLYFSQLPAHFAFPKSSLLDIVCDLRSEVLLKKIFELNLIDKQDLKSGDFLSHALQSSAAKDGSFIKALNRFISLKPYIQGHGDKKERKIMSFLHQAFLQHNFIDLNVLFDLGANFNAKNKEKTTIIDLIFKADVVGASQQSFEHLLNKLQSQIQKEELQQESFSPSSFPRRYRL